MHFDSPQEVTAFTSHCKTNYIFFKIPVTFCGKFIPSVWKMLKSRLRAVLPSWQLMSSWHTYSLLVFGLVSTNLQYIYIYREFFYCAPEHGTCHRKINSKPASTGYLRVHVYTCNSADYIL
jgi:hypothetical protein